MSRLLVFSHARIITRHAVCSLACICMHTRAHVSQGTGDSFQSLKRALARNYAQFCSIETRQHRDRCVHREREIQGPQLSKSLAASMKSRPRDEGETSAYSNVGIFFSCQRRIHAECALGLPFYRISFSRDSVLSGRKQKSDIVFVDEKIKHWIDSQIWAIKKNNKRSMIKVIFWSEHMWWHRNVLYI